MRCFVIEYTDNESLDCYEFLRLLLFRHSSVLGFSLKLPAKPGRQKAVICLCDSTMVKDRKTGERFCELPYIRMSIKKFRGIYPDSDATEIIDDSAGRMLYYW